MGACATKPGDLKAKAKGEAPLVVEDAVVAADEKAKAADVVPLAAAEVDQADVSRRRSLSDLLKREAEASDVEAEHQEAEKVMVMALAEEPASAAAAAAAGETMTMGSPEAPVQASVATEQQDDTAEELKLKDDLPSADAAQAAEEEKRVDPESVQVAVVADAPSSEESKAAAADAPSSEESKAADDHDAASA